MDVLKCEYWLHCIKKLTWVIQYIISNENQAKTYLHPSNTGFVGWLDEGEGKREFSSLFPKLPIETSSSSGRPASRRRDTSVSWTINLNSLVDLNNWK